MRCKACEGTNTKSEVASICVDYDGDEDNYDPQFSTGNKEKTSDPEQSNGVQKGSLRISGRVKGKLNVISSDAKLDSPKRLRVVMDELEALGLEGVGKQMLSASASHIFNGAHHFVVNSPVFISHPGDESAGKHYGI